MVKVSVVGWLAVGLCATGAVAQVNMGDQKPAASNPFKVEQVATLSWPWRIAFLPDSRMLITQKSGGLELVTPAGEKTDVSGAPEVLYKGQGGFLGVYLSPNYATDHNIYLTYSEPQAVGGSSLALARARLQLGSGTASLQNLQVIWRDAEGGLGGQFGAAVAFSPDKKYLYLTSGDRQRFSPAQDPNSPLGKVLRLTLDGKPAPGNPMAGKKGAKTLDVTDPPSDTEAAKTAKPVRTYTFPGDNLTPSETWSTGHRTPYGLAFDGSGRLWEVEHGPKGGDELNLIEKGKNYGWPLTSYSTNYNGVPIASPDTRPDLVKPVIYWNPVIAPGNLMFYKGNTFPGWNGDGIVSGLATKSLTLLKLDGKGGATATDRYDVGHRVRDIEEAPDGTLWMVEDDKSGGLFHVTPK